MKEIRKLVSKMIIRIFEENDGYHEMSIITAKIEDNEQFATNYAQVINEEDFKTKAQEAGIKEVLTIDLADDLLEIVKPNYEEVGSGYYKELAKAQTDEFKIEIINSYNQALRGGAAVTKILIEKI